MKRTMTNTSSDGPWISLCCKPGVLYPPESECYQNDTLTGGEITLPTIYDSNLSTSSMNPNDFVPRYGIQCGDNRLELGTLTEMYEDMGMRLFENGTIYLISQLESSRAGMEYWLDAEDYCLSYNIFDEETALSVCDSFATRFLSDVVLTVRSIFLGSIITMALPLPFLAATFIIYTILPELRNVHGLILRVYLACLFVGHIFYIVVATNVVAACYYSMTVTLHFLMLAVFFWLNVMCFDIWWTFRKFKPLQDSKRLNRKKFFFYSIYAWGCPALFVGVGAIIDNLSTAPKGIIGPGFHESCWFTESNLSETIYLDGPIAVTLISNTCFFVSTCVKMIRHKRKTAQQFNGSQDRWHNDAKQRFNLHLKLFIVMGITRSVQFVLLIFLADLPEHILVWTNLPNSLQGLAIFIIFVWKDKIKKLLSERFGCKGKKCFSKDSTEAYRHSTSITLTTTTSTIISLQEDSNISSKHSELVTEDDTNL